LIVNPRAGWWSVVFTLRGSTLPRIWQRVALAALVALLVTFSERLFGVQPLRLTSTPFSLIGVALGIFLGFRNNASYDRFWEARKLWGALVNTSRSFTRQAQTLILAPEGADEREMAAVEALQRALIHRQVAYVHGLRLHLRRATDWRELRDFIDEQELADLEGESNRPAALTHRTGALLTQAWRRGWVHPMHLPVLEGSLTTLTDIQGGCERILATPVPFVYNVLMHRIVAGYCLFLPFGLVDTIGWVTPLAVAFIAFAFYGLDSIGEEIEEPFGMDWNDLPLSQLSRMIEVNLRQRAGDKDIPPLMQPVDGVLT
jgi:putative membrane protein